MVVYWFYCKDNKCIAKSYWHSKSMRDKYPVYADATCIKFNTYGDDCVNNKININSTDNPTDCTTDNNKNSDQYIDIILPKQINIKKINIYNNTNDKNTNNSLYPIEIIIYNKNNEILKATKKNSMDRIEINEFLPRYRHKLIIIFIKLYKALVC